MKIEFLTSKYEAKYGKHTRGRGWWWFFFEGYEFEASGTYGEAKKACIAKIRELASKDYTGTVYIEVGT